MTDWIIKKTVTDAENANYSIVAIGRLISEDTLTVIVNDEIKTIKISNPKPIKGYDCLLYGYLSNDLEYITVTEMMDIPTFFLNDTFNIPFCYINPKSDRFKLTKSKGNKLVGYNSPEIFISIKVNTYYPFNQSLYILEEINKSSIETSKNQKGRKKKPKYICLATQLGT